MSTFSAVDAKQLVQILPSVCQWADNAGLIWAYSRMFKKQVADYLAKPQVSSEDLIRQYREYSSSVPTAEQERAFLDAISQARHVYRGSLGDCLELCSDLVSFLLPLDFEEWREVVEHAGPSDKEKLRQISAIVIDALTPSINQGLIEFDIAHLLKTDNDSATAWAIIWLLRAKFLLEAAWPTSIDVKTYADVRGIDVTEAQESTKANLAIWFQNSRLYEDRLVELEESVDHFKYLFLAASRWNSNRDIIHVRIYGDGRLVLQNYERSSDDSQEKWDVLRVLRIRPKERTVQRVGQKYRHVPPVKLSQSLWELFDQLASAGDDGITRRTLARILKIALPNVSQRKNKLKAALLPLDIGIPGDEFRLELIK